MSAVGDLSAHCPWGGRAGKVGDTTNAGRGAADAGYSRPLCQTRTVSPNHVRRVTDRPSTTVPRSTTARGAASTPTSWRGSAPKTTRSADAPSSSPSAPSHARVRQLAAATTSRAGMPARTSSAASSAILPCAIVPPASVPTSTGTPASCRSRTSCVPVRVQGAHARGEHRVARPPGRRWPRTARSGAASRSPGSRRRRSGRSARASHPWRARGSRCRRRAARRATPSRRCGR